MTFSDLTAQLLKTKAQSALFVVPIKVVIMGPAFAIAMVFVGCCSNVIFLEYLVTEQPSCGNIITFFQFFFIAMEGFIFTTKFGTEKPKIPLSTYVIMVSFFLVTSVVNNYAFNFKISSPLHMIFRAGSLMANLVLGILILKKSYKFSKYFSVLMISIGIAMSTIASAGEVQSDGSSDEESMYDFMWWLVGIGMLTFALFLSARMGIFQETVYTKHGKHPSEALFYNHALPLPMFLLLASDIYHHIVIFNNSDPMTLPLLSIAMPKLWVYLLGNVITQYICIKSVFILTTECTSLTVTLVVTLRKFVSLLFSIWYFQNPFTIYHWIGTFLVFGGTFIFTETFSRIRDALVSKDKKEQ